MRTLVIEFGSLSQDAHLKILKLCLLPNKITLTGSKDWDVDISLGKGERPFSLLHRARGTTLLEIARKVTHLGWE